MRLKGHFQVNSHEFSHVTMGEGILGTENRGYFKNTFQITTNGHLFVELRRLGQKGFRFEVGHLEHVTAPLRSGTDQLRGMNFNKVIFEEEFTEQVTHTRLNPENGLIGGGT